jgi:RHS repeat-associated protein
MVASRLVETRIASGKSIYDNKARLSTEQITIPGDSAYTYTWTYNGTTGLLDTLQYPVSTAGYELKLQYGYAYGILQSIADFNALTTVFWTANTANSRGQYTQEKLGNGVIVTHTLDAVTGWPSSIQAGVGGGATLQNNSYLFDYVGNLTQRQDNNLPVVTENVFPDSLNRLDHTVGDSSTAMSYDSMGRISAWGAGGLLSNVKDYTTPQSGCTYYANSQLHAVRKDTNGANYSSYCYDANGNLSAENGCWGGSCYSDSYSWTSYNQPSDISNSSNSSQFFYNANHQRYKQIASYGGSAETTFYVSGLLEKMINSSGTFYRHYIPAGNITVVVTRQLAGTNSTYYITKDHLGSSAVITDSNGALLVKEKFAALGWNENTTAEENTMAGITRHEFTGHEGLDNLSSVNMNGRIYQPSGSMFLSPDPYIPDPVNTQSYNRYAYVNNNPLSMVDPSGFCGYSLSYTPGSEATWIDNGDGTFSEGNPVTPGHYSISFNPGACFYGNDFRIPGGSPGKPPNSIGQLTTPPTPCLTPTGPIGSGKTSLYLAYTDASSTTGASSSSPGVTISIPDANHTFVIALDPWTGNMYATRGGPGSGPGGGPTTPYNQLVGKSGPFPGSGTAQFPDTPNNITGLQAIGDLSQSFDQVSAVMNNYTQVTDANNLTYTAAFNSNSYSFTFVALAGYQRPDPLMNVPGSQNGSPSPNVSCMRSTPGS